MSANQGWMFVCKPLRPPFRDGSTVMVRDLVAELPVSIPLTYFGDPQATVRRPGLDTVLSAGAMGYAPRLRDKARILAAVADPRRAMLPMHFFFTPNRNTSSVLAGLRRVQRRRLIVQSVMSSDGVEANVPLLRQLDAVIVASRWGATRLINAGLRAGFVHQIPPGVRVGAEPAEDVAGHRRLLYAGDLDEAVASRLGAIAQLLARPEFSAWSLSIACRPKGEGHGAALAKIRRAVEGTSLRARVEILGEVTDMPALLRRCSLQLFVADHVRRKVDIPLVVLEGMARGVGLASLDVRSLTEIFAAGRELDLSPGICRPDGEFLGGLAECMLDPASLRRYGSDARQLVRHHYTVDRMVKAYTTLYDSLSDKWRRV